MKENVSKRKTLAIIGIILIIIQAIAYYGMSGEYIGLYPDFHDILNYSPSSYIPVERISINASSFTFGLQAGFDRFFTSFSDLAYPKTEYRPMTAIQIASYMFRESFGCDDGGSIDLILYDTALSVSYFSVGIIGLILVVLAIKRHD